MATIENREDFERWLDGRDREIAVALAARSTLRVLPLWQEHMAKAPAKERRKTLLTVFRATAVAWLTSIGPKNSNLVKGAAKSADIAARRSPAAVYGPDGAANAASLYNDEEVLSRSLYTVSDCKAMVSQGKNSEQSKSKMLLDFWRALSADCAAIEGGMAPQDLARQPLWPGISYDSGKYGEGPYGGGGRPAWVTESWEGLRRSLNAVNGEHWVVWTRWYTDRLNGAPFDSDLEEARVLIPSHLWDEGPTAVNAHILELGRQHGIDYHARERADTTGGDAADASRPEIDIEALLAAPQLRVALADFGHDELTELMRMVRFVEDMGDVSDAERADRTAMLDELGTTSGELEYDLRDFDNRLPRGLRRDLGRYSREADKGVGKTNPRILWEKGIGFADAMRDPQMADALDGYLFDKLDRFVARHLDLMRLYFAGALARMRQTSEIELTEEATPDRVVEVARSVAVSLREVDASDLPGLDPEGLAVIDDMVEELTDLRERIATARSEADADRSERRFHDRAVAFIATVGRFAGRSMEVGAKRARDVVAIGALKEKYPETFRDGLDALGKLLRAEWPF